MLEIKVFFEDALNKVFSDYKILLKEIIYEKTLQSYSKPYFLKNLKKEKDFFEKIFFNKKNEFLINIAKEIAENPSSSKFNPVFFYGPSGSGKTKILKSIYLSISQKILQKNNIFYGSGEDFCNEILNNGLSNFFEQKNIFIVDNFSNYHNLLLFEQKIILFIEKCIYDKKLLIIADYKNPNNHNIISNKLGSKINLGLVLELKKPDLEIRMRFILMFCNNLKFNLSHNDILFLAMRCTNIITLKKILLQMYNYLQNSSHKLHQDLMENFIRSNIEDNIKISAQSILSCVAQYYNIKEYLILGNLRQKDIINARQIAMYLCRDILGLSYTSIGKFFGGKDHSTVLYTVEKIKKISDRNKNMQKIITTLRQKCFV